MPTNFAWLDATSEAETDRHMSEDDVIDLADAAFDDEAGHRVWRGRPPSVRPKVPINIRLSPDVLEAFKSTGPGWQTRMDEALRDYLREHPVDAA